LEVLMSEDTEITDDPTCYFTECVHVGMHRCGHLIDEFREWLKAEGIQAPAGGTSRRGGSLSVNIWKKDKEKVMRWMETHRVNVLFKSIR
jgi:hypothetical protein